MEEKFNRVKLWNSLHSSIKHATHLKGFTERNQFVKWTLVYLSDSCFMFLRLIQIDLGQCFMILQHVQY